MDQAKGTFGLVTTTSLQAGAVALAADRQPLFVGADPEAGALLYASEAAELKVVCADGPQLELVPLPYRFDLRDGDVVLLQVREGTADNTLTLAMSQSGQTFNTLDAAKFLHTLHGLGKAGPVFLMTGEIDTLMGAAVGQCVKAEAPWVDRVFPTGPGWRTAEPATVSSAAAHASLTQLLLHLVRKARPIREQAALAGL
jgi:hypothetical protein